MGGDCARFIKIWREKSADSRRTHARGVVAGVTAVEAQPARDRDLGLGRTGKANADIADILGISIRTVHKHMERIYQKLGIDNRHAAIAIAMEAALRRA
jgi:DNA-binding CsgD family transcriptional regulator